jgi:hypothetical protein
MSVVTGVIVIAARHAGDLNLPHQRMPRYGLRLGLGIVALAGSVVMARRKPRPLGSAGKKPGLMSRLTTHPAPPYVFYLIAPDLTTRELKGFGRWLSARKRVLLVGGLVVAGVIPYLERRPRANRVA